MKKIILAVLSLVLSLQIGALHLAAANGQVPATFGNTVHSSRLQEVVTKTKSTWPWYVTRASGLVAAFLLVLLIIFGIGLITGYTYRVMEPVSAWAIHRALGIALGVSILVHVIVLLFDKYAPFSLLQVLVPFTSHYTPVTIAGIHVGSLYVALGILAFYAAAIVIISSLVWMDKKPATWRLLHYTGYLLVLLVFLHGLYLGTDLKHGIPHIIWLAAGIVIIVGVIFRLRRARTITDDKS
jgi:sulfoxide reductase heme-binding subunit YedZ